MSAADTILSFATWMALAISAVAFLLTVWRVVKGPTLPDRVVALDMLVGIVIGFIALIAIRTGFTLYIDIAIALGLVGFLATIAFARFILAKSVKVSRAVAVPAPVEEGINPDETEPETAPPKKGRSRKSAESVAPKPAARPAEKPAAKRSGKSQAASSRREKPKKPGKAD